ncbi:hypothetical protein J4P02_23060 [Pseudomonas sp. NFXW11]|uniref:hypothetical protein n=1 Tax=Pseudomonas sp. NFXW11 TaxID=2819531 RepID=UPI003CE96EFC
MEVLWAFLDLAFYWIGYAALKLLTGGRFEDAAASKLWVGFVGLIVVALLFVMFLLVWRTM